jgi:hypothetical protein
MVTKPDRPVRRKLGGSILGMDWEEKTRQKIQSSQIANRLISFVNGEIVLEPAQVTAATTLLKKVLPDLANVTHSGDKDNPIQLTVLTGVPRAN